MLYNALQLVTRMPLCRTRHLNIPTLWKERFLQSNRNCITTTKPCKMCSLAVKQQNLAELTAQGVCPSLGGRAVPELQAVLGSQAVSHLPCARGGRSRLPTAAAAGSRNGWGSAASPRRMCTAAGNPGAKSNLWISQPQNRICIMPHLKWLIFLLRRL